MVEDSAARSDREFVAGHRPHRGFWCDSERNTIGAATRSRPAETLPRQPARQSATTLAPAPVRDVQRQQPPARRARTTGRLAGCAEHEDRRARRRTRRRRGPAARSDRHQRVGAGHAPAPGSAWCSRSSVAGEQQVRVRRSAQPPAARPGRRRAPRRRAAPVAGSSPRAVSVDSSVPGTRTVARRSGRGSSRTACTPSAVGPGQRQPAEQAGGGVVRVALHRAGEGEQRVVVHPVRAAGDQGASGEQPGDHRGGRRAEAAAVRDAVGAGQRERRVRLAERVQRGVHGAHHEVPGVGRAPRRRPRRAPRPRRGRRRPGRRRSRRPRRAGRAPARGSRSPGRGSRWSPGPGR